MLFAIGSHTRSNSECKQMRKCFEVCVCGGGGGGFLLATVNVFKLELWNGAGCERHLLQFTVALFRL